MDDFVEADLEQDPRFPSGAWTGFYLQYWIPGRHKTNLQLTCHNGRLSGTGKDRVGRFTIEGNYNLNTAQCAWTKQYVGRHSIAYQGVNDGRGIWGVYEMKQLWGLLTDRGGFHIWPEGSDMGAESDEAEQALLAVMRKDAGNRALRKVFVTFLILIAGLAVAMVFLLHKF